MILKSNRILILTHLSIDHDAVCSTLLLRHILKKFFEKNNVDIVVQESHWPQFESLNLPGISRIKNISASTSLDLSNYNLIFIVDVNRIERCLHNSKLQDNYLENLIIIDHHDSLTDRQAAVYINDGYSSAVEQIYLTFKDLTGRSFIPDKQISQLTQIGMIADTNCFLYDKVSKKTYQIMSEIVDLYNLNREILMKQLIGTEKNSALVLGNILDHLYFRNDMAYSYLSPHFTSRKKLTPEEITGGTGIFLQ
ncbi:MAG: DHH family phosphoesterase, partial [Patescibacteria group bacterium]|nr:DHH family phosphoesterase [Patescibacteria group bacterium]